VSRLEIESNIDGDVAFAGEGIRDLEGHAGLGRFQALIEVVDIDFEELAIIDGGQGVGGLAGEIGHDAHDEGQLDFFFRTVEFHIILNLHSGGPIPCDELLTARFRHDSI
jgi:hypothetical protein